MGKSMRRNRLREVGRSLTVHSSAFRRRLNAEDRTNAELRTRETFTAFSDSVQNGELARVVRVVGTLVAISCLLVGSAAFAQPPGGPPGSETVSALIDAPPEEPPISATCGEWSDVPIERPFPSGNPVYLSEGAVIEQAVDMSIPGPVQAYSAVRSYNSRISGSDILGGQWVSNAVDRRLGEDGDDIELVIDATSKRVFTYDSGSYTSPDDSTLTLVEDSTNSQFVLTNWATGQVDIFHDFDATNPGYLKEQTTLAWQDAGKDGIEYTFNSSHEITQITTAEGQEHNIVFSYTSDKLTKIEARTGSTTSTRYKVVDYTY